MGPGAALGGSGVGRTDCNGECCARKLVCCCWEVGGGEKEGAERMWSSAQPLESGSWQLVFTSCQFILERLVVLYAIRHPSLRDQVIREHRQKHFVFLYVYYENRDGKSKEVTVWKLFSTLA